MSLFTVITLEENFSLYTIFLFKILSWNKDDEVFLVCDMTDMYDMKNTQYPLIVRPKWVSSDILDYHY